MKDVALTLVQSARGNRTAPVFTDFRVGRLLLSRHFGTTGISSIESSPEYARRNRPTRHAWTRSAAHAHPKSYVKS